MAVRRAKLGTHLVVHGVGADRPELADMAEWKSQGGLTRRVVRLWRYNRRLDALRLPRGLWPLPARLGPFAVDDGRLRLPEITFPRRKDAPVLEPVQREAAEKVWRAGGGLLEAPGGTGKTVVAWSIIGRWRQPALWIVDSEPLVQQALAEARRMFALPSSAFGVALDGSIRPGTHVTVGTRQTLARGVTRSFTRLFGTVWVDEVDRSAAATYIRLVQWFPARHRGGATATLERADKLHPAVVAVFGPVAARITEAQAAAAGRFFPPTIEFVQTGFHYPWPGDWPTLQAERALDPIRNIRVAKRAAAEVRAGRSVLVLCQLVDQAEQIVALLRRHGVDARLLTGEVAAEIRARRLEGAKTRRVPCLVATRVLDRGVDVPVIDRVLLADAYRSAPTVQQQVYRATRTAAGKTTALVVDFCDRGPQFEKQQWARRRLYEQRGWLMRGPLPDKPERRPNLQVAEV